MHVDIVKLHFNITELHVDINNSRTFDLIYLACR